MGVELALEDMDLGVPVTAETESAPQAPLRAVVILGTVKPNDHFLGRVLGKLPKGSTVVGEQGIDPDLSLWAEEPVTVNANGSEVRRRHITVIREFMNSYKVLEGADVLYAFLSKATDRSVELMVFRAVKMGVRVRLFVNSQVLSPEDEAAQIAAIVAREEPRAGEAHDRAVVRGMWAFWGTVALAAVVLFLDRASFPIWVHEVTKWGLASVMRNGGPTGGLSWARL